MSVSILSKPPRAIEAALLVKHFTKAYGFSRFRSFVRNDSYWFGATLWTLLIRNPEIILGDSLFVSKSKTNYLYVIAKHPPLRKSSALLFKMDVLSAFDIFYKDIIYFDTLSVTCLSTDKFISCRYWSSQCSMHAYSRSLKFIRNIRSGKTPFLPRLTNPARNWAMVLGILGTPEAITVKTSWLALSSWRTWVSKYRQFGKNV